MSGHILVLGATGQIGRHLIPQLVARGEGVRAASRTGAAVEGAEGVRFDYRDAATHGPAFAGVDRVFALVPAGELDSPGLLGPVFERAAAQGARVVLMTALGVDADDRIPFRQAELKLAASGAPWVVIRPNWFMDNFETYWRSGVLAGEVALPAGEGATSFIDVRDIADAAAAALGSDRFDGRAFNLTGPEALTYAEAVAVLSRALGRPLSYRPSDDASFVTMVTGLGVPEDYARFLAGIFHPVREGWAAGVTGDVEELAGHAPRRFADYAPEAAGRLSAAG